MEKTTPLAVQNKKFVPQVRAIKAEVDRLLAVERAGLFLFGAAQSPLLVNELLSRIKSDKQLSLQMVEYFIQTAPGDKYVASKLKALAKSSRWPTLKNRIDDYLLL